MRLLILCEQGNNRSVTLAGQLKYLGHDILTAGLHTNSPDTVRTLGDWAQKVILTDRAQVAMLPLGFSEDKVAVWQIGPDNYPRPYNKELLQKVRQLVDVHRAELL